MKKFFLFISLLSILLLISSCNKKNSNILPYTDTTVSSYFMDTQWKLMSKYDNNGAFPFTGDRSYAIVNYDWLFVFYETWRDEIFKQDVIAWDDKFDCNKFTSSFVSRAQIEYYKKVWRTNKPQSLALGEVWFITKGIQSHALVAALTNKGLVFFEPQTGKEITLTQEQQASIYLKKF